jgi:hypothetical protein
MGDPTHQTSVYRVESAVPCLEDHLTFPWTSGFLASNLDVGHFVVSGQLLPGYTLRRVARAVRASGPLFRLGGQSCVVLVVNSWRMSALGCW